MSGWLDALLGRIRNAGTDLVQGYGLNFKGGLEAVRNQSTRFVDVDVKASSVQASHLAIAAASGALAPELVIRTPFTVASPAVGADDITVLDSLSFGIRILDCAIIVFTAVGGSTGILRSATGGGGSTLSSTISTAAVGTIRNNFTFTRTLTAGQSIYLRRSTDQIAGEVIVRAVRT